MGTGGELGRREGQMSKIHKRGLRKSGSGRKSQLTHNETQFGDDELVLPACTPMMKEKKKKETLHFLALDILPLQTLVRMQKVHHQALLPSPPPFLALRSDTFLPFSSDGILLSISERSSVLEFLKDFFSSRTQFPITHSLL